MIAEDYFINQARFLHSQYESSVVLGDSGDTGFNRETILRDWLNKHLPRIVSPEFGGRIIDAKHNNSGQIDLAIYNNSFPRFGSNPKSYFFAEGVIYAIQIKSKLTSSSLKSAINNLATVKRCNRKFASGMFIGNPSSSIPTGIFAFDTTYKSSESVLKALQKFEKQGLPPVNFVCINKKAYIGYNSGNAVGIDKNGKALGKLPIGYIVIQNTDISIWNMLLEITNEGRKIVFAGVDFQKYMLNMNSSK